MLQGIQEMGSHVKDIYDFLVAGIGRCVCVGGGGVLFIHKLILHRLSSPSRSTDHRLSSDAESYSHDCNIAVLPVLCTVPRPSHNGQSQALPAQGSHDSLQLCASGFVSIHSVWSKFKCCSTSSFLIESVSLRFKNFFMFIADCFPQLCGWTYVFICSFWCLDGPQRILGDVMQLIPLRVLKH